MQKTVSCIDKVNELDNKDCQEKNFDYYISLLSTNDYVNIGNKNSYVINNEYFYLNNINEEKEIWYIDPEGKITTNNGLDIIGIKPVITIKANIDYISGKGYINDPYIIEKDYGLFGGYVKLDNDIWRIYQVNENDVRLVLNDYLKINNSNLEYIYSNISTYHNDYNQGTIAHYLNNTFLNTLSYKDKIKEVKWSNGYYGSNSNYDYEAALSNTINSKVGLISIGDIRLNNTLEDYFTLTGTKNKGSMIYTIKSNQKIYTKSIQNKSYIIPTISLEKELLTKGNGTYNSPFEME